MYVYINIIDAYTFCTSCTYTQRYIPIYNTIRDFPLPLVRTSFASCRQKRIAAEQRRKEWYAAALAAHGLSHDFVLLFLTVCK